MGTIIAQSMAGIPLRKHKITIISTIITIIITILTTNTCNPWIIIMLMIIITYTQLVRLLTKIILLILPKLLLQWISRKMGFLCRIRCLRIKKVRMSSRLQGGIGSIWFRCRNRITRDKLKWLQIIYSTANTMIFQRKIPRIWKLTLLRM